MTFATPLEITGTILSKDFNSPLSGAHIYSLNDSVGAISDPNGNYRLTNLKSEFQIILVSHIGYKDAFISQSANGSIETGNIIYLNTADIDLEELTVSESRNLNLKFVNALDIKFRPLKSTQEMLSVVPGLFIAKHSGGGKAEQIFLRGFDIDHGTDVNIQVDGTPVNMVSHTHGQGYSDLHFVIPEIIKSVQFEKGMYSADIGNFGTAGAVEFITKDIIDQNVIKLEYGSFDKKRVMGAFKIHDRKTNSGRNSAYIASDYLFSNGYFDKAQDLTRVNLFGKYRTFLDQHTLLESSFSLFKSNWKGSSQIPQRAIDQGIITRFGTIDPNERGQTERNQANFELIKSFKKDGVFKNQIYLVNYKFDLISNFTFYLNDLINGDRIQQKESRNIVGYNGEYFKHFSLYGFSGDLQTGFSMRYDLINDNQLKSIDEHEDVISIFSKGDIKESNSSLFFSTKLFINEDFSLTTGLRADLFFFQYENGLEEYSISSKNKFLISPKIEAEYFVNENFQLYAKWGKGFHSNDSRTTLRRKNNKSVPQANGLDLGFIIKPIKGLIIEPTFWTLNLEDELVYVGDEGVVEPSGKSLRRGLDFSTRFQFKKWLRFDYDVNFAYARFVNQTSSFDYIPLAPSLTSAGGMTFISKNLEGSFRFRYMADRPANEDYSLTAEGYLICDSKIQWHNSKYEISMSLDNIFNVKWKETQFSTLSRLENEIKAIEEIHFLSGAPISFNFALSILF